VQTNRSPNNCSECLLFTLSYWWCLTGGVPQAAGEGAKEWETQQNTLLRWQTKLCLARAKYVTQHEISQKEHNSQCPSQNWDRKDQECPTTQKATKLHFCEPDGAYYLTLLSDVRFAAAPSDLKHPRAHLLLCSRHSCQQRYKHYGSVWCCFVKILWYHHRWLLPSSVSQRASQHTTPTAG